MLGADGYPEASGASQESENALRQPKTDASGSVCLRGRMRAGAGGPLARRAARRHNAVPGTRLTPSNDSTADALEVDHPGREVCLLAVLLPPGLQAAPGGSPHVGRAARRAESAPFRSERAVRRLGEGLPDSRLRA